MAGERKDIRLRLAALLRERLEGDGWEVFHYAVAAVPETGQYIIIRTGPTSYDFWSEQFEVDELTMILTCVTAPLTQALDGEIEDIHDDMIDEVRRQLYRAFCDGADGQFLRSAAYPTAPGYLHPAGCSLASDRGASVMQDSGTGQKMLATEFTINTPLFQDVEGEGD
jgi:hypothetical protein